MHYPEITIPTWDSFYFRLINGTLFYTETLFDVNVLGSIMVKEIKYVKVIDKGCIKVK